MAAMTQEQAFLRAVLENPADDAPRLIFADWLEEQGDPRGEFIRVQCELAVMEARHIHECTSTVKRGMESASLRRRERELLEAQWYAFHGIRGCGAVALNIDHGLGGERDPGGLSVLFRHGFVASVSLPCAAFLEHAEALFAAAPIEDVRLTDREPNLRPENRGQRLPTEIFWWQHQEPRDTEPYYLEPGLFSCLTVGYRVGHMTGYGGRGYSSVKAAHAALSAACVRYGRAAAGLSELVAV